MKEFSKNAKSYNKHNIIQKKVAKELVSIFEKKYKTILDLGCGSGEICRLIEWDFERFVAVDSSKKMCSLHPKSDNIIVLNMDYENPLLYKKILKNAKFDIVCSSSSLQWCRDLDKTVEMFSEIAKDCIVSVFCDGTFKTIYQTCELNTFLPSYAKVVDIFSKYYDITYKREFYELYFKDNISKFRYIKKSGVSGGKRKLDYKQTKNLIKNYPLEYLEFEILYIKGDKKLSPFTKK